MSAQSDHNPHPLSAQKAGRQKNQAEADKWRGCGQGRAEQKGAKHGLRAQIITLHATVAALSVHTSTALSAHKTINRKPLTKPH